MRVNINLIFALTLIIAGFMPAMAEEPGVHRFATFNVRYVNSNNGDTGDKLWANRRKAVTDIVKDYDFDIVGFQEVTGNNKDPQTGKSQLQDMKDMLPEYATFDVEREGKNYSYNSIFYKKDKYTVVEKGFWYINSHPETPGNTWPYFGDANTIARTLAWIRFRDNESQKEFYFACTHMNYSKASNGVYGAELNARMLHDVVGQMPVVLVGDFNMYRSDEDAYRHYRSYFYDAALCVPSSCIPKGNFTHTTNGWYPADNSNCKGNAFDYQFYDHITAISHHIITEDYNRGITPSDHFPVMVRYKFQDDTPAPTRFYASNTDELLTAISSATQQDTICLAQGEYILNETIEPSVSLTFIGGYDNNFQEVVGLSVLRQSQAKQIFNIPQYYSLYLHNLHLDNGKTESTLGGGLLAINGGKLGLYNCRFSNGQSTNGNAGAVYADAHDIHIENCEFYNNSAKNNGGALMTEALESLTIINSTFHDNTSTTGAATYTLGGRISNIQCNSFYNNASTKQGALTIIADQYSASANLVNNSFLNNTLFASKGIASATKDFGGAGLYAKMNNDTQLFNMAHCSFIGNYSTFAGNATNFGGGALRISQGKSCLMNNLLLANVQQSSDSELEYVDYTVANLEALWRNTENLLSSSELIPDWENAITSTIAGKWDGKIFTADVRKNGTYKLLSKTLGDFNLCYLTTHQRLCESAFSFDVDGDGAVKNNYLNYDQVHRTRGIKACVGALEYTDEIEEDEEDEEDQLATPSTPAESQIQSIGKHQYIVNGATMVHVFDITGQCVLESANSTIDLSSLPSGLYIVNQHKIIR